MKTLILAIYLCWVTVGLSSQTGFLFFGDSGTGEPAQYQTAQSMKTFCENNLCQFVAMLGDNFYPSGVTSVKDPQWKKAFEDPYRSLAIPFFATLGNHDYKGNIEAQIKYSHSSKLWKMPSRYYSFSKGDIDFFVLDTNDFDETQQNWLEDALEKSQKPWKIAYGHHPIYSYGEHGNSDELEEDLLPILEGKVQFYLSGHDHNKQVIEKKSSDVTFIVSGAAAQSDPLKLSRKAIYTSSTLGFAHFLISKSKATLRIIDRKGKVGYSQVFENKRNRAFRN